MLSGDEIERYMRQMVLPGWGAAGQERVRAATVMVWGEGPAAEAASIYLARAGVRLGNGNGNGNANGNGNERRS